MSLRVVTFPLPSGKRSRCYAPRTAGCERSPDRSDAVRQRFSGSCAATPRLGAGSFEYRALVAQWKAQQAAKRPKTAKLVTNVELRGYGQDRLAGVVRRPDGTIVAGSTPPPWIGPKQTAPHRADRRWSVAWSPEQISQRLTVYFLDDESMSISHEAIYQSLFIEGRGALKRELAACLRTGRALREPRARSGNKPQGHVTSDVVLSQRPAEAEDRAVPGHWEGDLIIGVGRSAIGTRVERRSRATLLVHLPRQQAGVSRRMWGTGRHSVATVPSR